MPELIVYYTAEAFNELDEHIRKIVGLESHSSGTDLPTSQRDLWFTLPSDEEAEKARERLASSDVGDRLSVEVYTTPEMKTYTFQVLIAADGISEEDARSFVEGQLSRSLSDNMISGYGIERLVSELASAYRVGSVADMMSEGFPSGEPLAGPESRLVGRTVEHRDEVGLVVEELKSAQDALRTVEHSMLQARIPGNDRHREIELSLKTVQRALKGEKE